MEIGIVVARLDAELVPARGIKVTDRVVFLGRKAEEPVPRRIARDMALIDCGYRKLHRDVTMGVSYGPLVRGIER